MVKKAVILARGLGTRMQKEADVEIDEINKEIADKGLKGMIMFNERPFLDYILSKLIKAGFDDICLVIGPEHDIIRKYYSNISKRNKDKFKISFAIQEKPLGTANAVLSAEKFCGNDEFLVINADNLYGEKALSAIKQTNEKFAIVLYEKSSLISQSNIAEERIKRFGIGIFDNNFLREIVEKPENPEKYSINGRIYVSMSCFKFGKEIFDVCKELKINDNFKEYHIVDAINLLAKKHKIKVYCVNEGVIDLTSKSDILSVKNFLEREKLEF